MNVTVIVQLNNLPDATDLETVRAVVRRHIAEWLDFDRHPEDMHVTVEARRPCPSSV
jgi:hypothetical protein